MQEEPKSNKDKPYVYHLTSAANLDSICAHGLLSRAELERRGMRPPRDVANREIIQRRRELGILDCVPFHFITRSPFDYEVVRSNPRDAWIVIAVSREHARRSNWQIATRHPLSNAEILPWAEGHERIAWHEMDKRPRNWAADHDCKMVCSAEALAGTRVHVHEFAAVFTPTKEAASEVEQVLRTAGVVTGRVWVTHNAHMFP